MVKFTDIVKSSLQENGVDVEIAADYDSALKKLQSERFDLIMIDVGLVGPFNGIDLLREIRKEDKQTKIFILTAYGEEYKADAQAAGADQYFMKPLDPVNHILKPLRLVNYQG